MRTRRLTAILLVCLGVAAPSAAADWPVWRGPSYDGHAVDGTFVQGWLETGIEECWRRPIGAGYAGLAVADGTVYTMDSAGRDEFVVALNAQNGQERWRAAAGAVDRSVYGGDGPRVMPTVGQDHLYTVSSDNVLMALERETGRRVWQRGLVQEFGSRPPAEGYASSPLLHGDLLLVPLGAPGQKALAAFDRKTGETVWTSQNDARASYSSPVPWTFGGVGQALFLSASVLFSVDAVSGELLWKYDWPTYDYVNVATPLVIPPDRVFISAGYDQGGALLRVRPGRPFKVEEIWRNRTMKNHFSSSVYHGGALFGFDESILTAVDLASGKELWRARGYGKGSLILADRHLIVMGEDGDLGLVAATSAKFQEVKKTSVFNGRSWTPPSLADGRLYLRNRSEALCLEPSRETG